MIKIKRPTNSDYEWIKLYENSLNEVSEERTKFLEEQAIARITAVNGLKACYGWSGGKDSVVIADLIKKSEIKAKPVIWRGINDYPAVSEWIDKNKPKGLKEIFIDKYSLEYINKNPGFLFLQGGNKFRQAFMATKWKYQRDFIADYDVFITGRRLVERNVCGNASNGFLRGKTLSPIADWKDEECFAYIRRNNLSLSPFYSWPRGFQFGSVALGEWTERPLMGLTVDEVFNEIYEIDKSIVIDAASRLKQANEYLERRNNE